jgi:hypothetical protein
MDKLLVEIFIPAANQTFDVFIPKRSRLYEVADLLTSAVGELSAVAAPMSATEKMVLCDRESGNLLNINLTMEELGLINGSKLMLL